MNHFRTIRSSMTARLSGTSWRLLVALIRRMALWCGAKPPPGGWRDIGTAAPSRVRPLKRSQIVALRRERRETFRVLSRVVPLVISVALGLFLLVQWRTPEQMALQRLKSQTGATNAIASSATQVSKLKPQEYPSVAFDELAGFDFNVTPDTYDGRGNLATASAKVSEQIPDSVKRKDGLPAAVQGFMLPFKLEKGKAVEWLLCRDQSDCCFGKTPRMNHWVLVRSPQGVKPTLGQPVTCSGTLLVGEMRDNGFLTGIYQMDAVDTRLTD